MSTNIYTAIYSSPIDAATETKNLQAATGDDTGAIVSFLGTVRGGEVSAMTLEHYPGMTESALQEIAEMAASKWDLSAIRLIHRIGKMNPGEIIVFTGTGSAHRAEAFAACSFMMDYLKTRAPFWKKEETAEGTRWVDATDKDEQARQKWEE